MRNTGTTEAPPASLVILISGRGSNMLAIAKACESGELQARISLVISNRPDAPGLITAKAMGLPTASLDHTHYSSRQLFDDALAEHVRAASPDWIVLAGFMRILSPAFIAQWPGRIVNIHPSLLPLYPGLNTHRRALAAGDTHAGASVHVVTAELDQGPVIAQVRLPILPNDDERTLAERVLNIEHALYIDALRQCIGQTTE